MKTTSVLFRLSGLMTILFAWLISVTTQGQTPSAMNYQAVVRNSSGNLIPLRTVNFRFSIVNFGIGGPVDYAETVLKTTDQFGLVTHNIGTGIVVSGSFAAIDWTQYYDNKFLQVEIDTTGGTAFVNMGIQQILTVPYAQYAKQSGNGITNGTAPWQTLLWNGSRWYASSLLRNDDSSIGLNTNSTGGILGYATLNIGAANAKDGSIIATGTFGTGATYSSPPDLAPLLLWSPRKSAFRAGTPSFNRWDDSNIGNYSFAVGAETKASGAGSAALGNGNRSEGDNSFSAGTDNIASGYTSFSIGINNLASGGGSFATGSSNVSSGSASFSSGRLNNASGTYSFVTGSNSTVSGDNASSLGINDTASGYASMAIGERTVATNFHSFAGGYGSRSTGLVSFSFGNRTVSSGQNSFAIGNQSLASGMNATALGLLTEAAGSNSFAGGWGTSANGSSSFAFGGQTVANGSSAVAFGEGDTALGDNTLALGFNVRARSNNSVAIGSYINAGQPGAMVLADGYYNGSDPTSYSIGSNTLLARFNGGAYFTSDNSTNAAKFVSIVNGKLGIGTISPAYQLEIRGNMKLMDGTEGNEKILSSDLYGAATWKSAADLGLLGRGVATGYTPYWNGTSWSTSALLFNSGSKIGIGTTAPTTLLDVSGSFRIADGTEGAGKILTSSATGITNWKTPTQLNIPSAGSLSGQTLIWNGTSWSPSSLIFNNGVKVGVGTTSPSALLDVSGSFRIADGTEGAGKILTSYANGITSWKTATELNIPGAGSANNQTLRWNGTNWIPNSELINDGSNVGIGVATPAAKLDVAGTVKIADGTQGQGKVLTSDASGNAGWSYPTSLYQLSGAMTPIAAATSSFMFSGPTTTITLTSSKRITGVLSFIAGTSVAGSGSFDFSICYLASGGAVTSFAPGSFLTTPVNTVRMNYTASNSIVLGPGTYTIGLGIRNGSTVAINNNDFLNGWIMITDN